MNREEHIFLDTGTTSGDKYIKLRLENDTDTFEVLSLRIDTRDAYRDFNADYGVLVGRVVANDGIGIPNAKISIFIPLEEEDENDNDIVNIYPYKTPRDKNNQGKRYNLLPRVSTINPETGEVKPKQPFGSFPIKPEIVTNSKFLDVYKKYYKYTAVTNEYGDYMIFGAPVGTQIVHMSVDITDIGPYSMTPAAMVTNLGYSPNLFTDDNTRIKPSNDLTDLPHIETQEISVDVIPFWGDTNNFDIGITRQDFRIRAQLINTFTIFGSVFTDGDGLMWGHGYNDNRNIAELYRAGENANAQVSISSKRIGRVTEKIYYYPNTVTDEDLNNPNIDVTDQLQVLDPSQYSFYKREGDFVFIVNCNRRKVVTAEDGSEEVVPDDSEAGIFTEFKGFITLEISEDDLPMEFTDDIGRNTRLVPFRYKLKFPQDAPLGNGIDVPNAAGNQFGPLNWRKKYKTFRGSNYYTVSRFHSTVFNNFIGFPLGNDNPQFPHVAYGFLQKDEVNVPYLKDSFNNVGVIVTESFVDGDDNPYPNDDFEFPSNTTVNIGSNTYRGFGANWMNMSVYLPQVADIDDGYEDVKFVRSNTNFHEQQEDDLQYNRYFVTDNTQLIGGTEFNTKFFARSDIHWTDIVQVPVEDIIKMRDIPNKGFLGENFNLIGSKYKNGKEISDSPPIWTKGSGKIDSAGKENGDPNNPNRDPKTYFYKGFGEANVIDYLFDLGIVT